MRRSGDGDRGAIGIALTMIVTVTLGGAALVVDGGRAMTARRYAASTADAAARWAVSDQPLLGAFDPDRARSAALTHAVRSGVAPEDVSVDVRSVGGRPEVQVSVTQRRRSVFLVLVAVSELSVTARGAATVVWER